MKKSNLLVHEKEIIKEYLSGSTYKKLGKKYNVCLETIRKFLMKRVVHRRNTRFSEKIESEICNTYLSGETTHITANKYGTCHATVCNILKRNRIERRTHKKLNDEQIEKVCQEYLNGASIPQLADKFIVCGVTILNVLKEKNVKRRTISEAVRIYSLDENFFNIIDSEEKAYWLGFIIADGCVTEYTLHMRLQIGDTRHLEKLKLALDSMHPIVIVQCENEAGEEYEQAVLNITSKKLVTALNKYGVIKNKVFKTYISENIPKEFMPHLCRGLVDGDGGINYDKSCKTWGINLAGTKRLLKEFDVFVQFYANIKNQRTLYKMKRSFKIVYKGNIQAFKVGTLLYENSNINCRLDRKYDNFFEIKRLFFNRYVLKFISKFMINDNK